MTGRSVASHHGDDYFPGFPDEETDEVEVEAVRNPKKAIQAKGARQGSVDAATKDNGDDASDEEPIMGPVRRTSQRTRAKGTIAATTNDQ